MTGRSCVMGYFKLGPRVRHDLCARSLDGVNSVELAHVAGCYADGVNVRLSSPNAETYRTAAIEAAEGTTFATSGWASVHDQPSPDKAYEPRVDRLILSRLEPLTN